MRINRTKLHRFYRYILDWLYPNVCPCCNRIIEYDKDFCDECAEELTEYKDRFTIPKVDAFTAYCVYDKNISPAILEFKHDDGGNSYYAFACRIKTAIERDGIGRDIDYIVPIPMTKESFKKRGYNQAELMAKELRYMIDVPYANVLIKTRNTAMQKTLGKKERAANLKDAFAVSPQFGEVKEKNFLLIDDVCTTGSTFAEAAKVLKEKGAAKVYAVSFAKTDNKPEKLSDADDSDLKENEKNFFENIY